MLKYIVAFLLLTFPTITNAEPEPKCHLTCLKDGHYSVTCGSICNADESLGHPFVIARRQYNCMTGCENSDDKTLLGCVLECKIKIKEDILAAKDTHIRRSIAGAESIIEAHQSKEEKEIEDKITSKEVKLRKPQLLVIK